MKLTDKNFMEETKKQVAGAMEELANGKSARDISKDIYLTLDNKTEDIAYMMTDNMIEIIENYHNDFDACYADEDAYIKEKLNDRVKDIDNALGRCEVYHRILVNMAANAIYAEGGNDAEARARAYVEENKDFNFTAEEAEEKETELYNLACEAIKKGDIVTIQLCQILEQLDAEEFTEAAVGVKLGRESADIKLILAMQAYVNAQRGLYEDITPETSIEQITYNVCGAADVCAVATQVGEGTVSESIVVKILKTIGAVIGWCGMFYGEICATAFLGGLIWMLLPVPLFIAMVISGCAVVFIDDKLGLVDKAAAVGSVVGGYVGCVVGAALKGIKKLVEWVTPYIITAINWVKNTVCNFITLIADKKTEGTTEQMRVESEVLETSEDTGIKDESKDEFNEEFEEEFEEESDAEVVLA